jgi:hypothetical protein
MREIRAEDMKERIRGSTLLTDVFNNIGKMQTLADEMEGGEESNLHESTSKINALQMTNNQRFKLLDKVLPTPKEIDARVSATEMSYDEWIDAIRAARQE